MTGSRISYLWTNGRAANGFASGVSLHNHTNRSKETLDFIVKLAHEYSCFSGIMAREKKRCRQNHSLQKKSKKNNNNTNKKKKKKKQKTQTPPPPPPPPP